jgi:hypothetical protein
LLIAAAIFGGGIRVQNIEIPPIGRGGRLASAVVGGLFLVVFFLIPPPESGAVKPSGQVALRGPHSVRIKLELMPGEPIATTELVGDAFEFPKHVPEGNYVLMISSIENAGAGMVERLLDTITVPVRKGKAIPLSQNADGKFRSGYEADLVAHLIKKYKDYDWRMQVTAIEQLSDLARREPTVVETLRKKVQGADPAEAVLAAFALSRNCVHQDQATKTKLREIWTGSTSRFSRIRARASLQCDQSERGAVESDLLEMVTGRATLVSEAPLAEQRGLKTTAAYFLAMRGSRLQCVVETLIAALDSQTELARDRAYDGLRMVSRESRRSPIKADWEIWWSESKDQYESCPG